jgi:beta-barrel assembly-enhancing protease
VLQLLIRLGIGLLFTLFGLFNYYGNVADNPITGERQRVQLSIPQEIALGRQSVDDVARQYNNRIDLDPPITQYINRVGQRVVTQSKAKKVPYPYQFHLISDPRTINAFALPGGQIFITTALLGRLNSEAQLAGVLGHEIGHVVGRHGSEHLAKQQLGGALANAVGIATSDGYGGGRQAQVVAQAVNQMLSLRYGRNDELESDRLGLAFMTEAGYDPRGLVQLMQILDSSRSGGEPPEFLSTHPNPGNRVVKLNELIAQNFPNGIPQRLEQGKQSFSQNVLVRFQRSSS